MKKSLLWILLLSAFTARSQELPQVRSSLKSRQEIRYLSQEAQEVYLVWGINNWNIPPRSWWPAGSFIKDRLLYTPMKEKAYGFSSMLKLPAGTTVDYVFWITRGPAGKKTDVWDLNFRPAKDYHTYVMQDNIALIDSKVRVRSKEMITILDFSIELLSISATFFFFLLLMRVLRFGKELPVHASPVNVVVAVAIVLSTMLILARASVVGLSAEFYLKPFTYFPKIFWAGFYDVLYVTVLSAICIFTMRMAKSRTASKVIAGLFSLLALLSLVAGILNIRMVEMLGKPFSYPWFYYSDFLKSTDARAALAANISPSYVMSIVLVCAAALFMVLSIVVLTDLMVQQLKMKKVLVSSLVCCSTIYIAAGPEAIRENDWKYEKLANPLVEFAGSMSIFSGTPQLFTMPVPDSLRFPLPPKRKQPLSLQMPGVKNVIVCVLESTPAEYVQPYAKEYEVTPVLKQYLSEAVVFDNVYAHAPATNNSMVSILGSVYPWLSYNSLTREHPDVKMTTIADELKQYGYRTAFFNSADNRFQKAGEFLQNRRFDQVSDCSTLQCDNGFEVHDDKWEFLDGKDDACTADNMMNWVRQDKKSPFFAMMWTYQTHYPYFASGREQYYSADPVLNRYLNAVHHSDEVLGNIIQSLKKNGLYESTLIVVVGDHGEAFGRHGQTTHASGIYEENLHVPCVFINPAFKGDHYKGIGGLVDIAPTVMNCLGYASAFQWHGKNLFTAKENDRVYFFTPWADYLFGFREGNRKYIYNATANTEEVYDLEKDPHESENLAGRSKNNTVYQQRLAGWVQAVNQSTARMISQGAQ
jgi:arylsulfatase A-like enzyme